MSSYKSPRQIARELDVAEVTVYRWLKSGDLPCIRPGGRLIRVSDDDFRTFKATRQIAS